MTALRRPLWCQRFLLELHRNNGNVLRSAELAGVTRRAVYAYRARSVSFAVAMAAVFARLEQERAA